MSRRLALAVHWTETCDLTRKGAEDEVQISLDLRL